jgi:hypothetical protein
MADYGHELRFGVMLEPEAEWGREVPVLAELAEQAGLDLAEVAPAVREAVAAERAG